MDPLAAMLAKGDASGVPGQLAAAIKAANDNQSSLDAVANANALKIIAFGQTTLSGAVGVYTPADVALDAGLATTFICFLTRSDQPGKVYPIPYLEVAGAAGSLQARLTAAANVYSGGIHFYAESASDYVSPPSLTFFYYMLAQPANATS